MCFEEKKPKIMLCEGPPRPAHAWGPGARMSGGHQPYTAHSLSHLLTMLYLLAFLMKLNWRQVIAISQERMFLPNQRWEQQRQFWKQNQLPLYPGFWYISLPLIYRFTAVVQSLCCYDAVPHWSLIRQLVRPDCKLGIKTIVKSYP